MESPYLGKTALFLRRGPTYDDIAYRVDIYEL